MHKKIILLTLLLTLGIYLWYEYDNHQIIVVGVAELAPACVKIAHAYHGIDFSTQELDGQYYFERNGKIYNLFDFRMFPQLKSLIEENKNGNENR